MAEVKSAEGADQAKIGPYTAENTQYGLNINKNELNNQTVVDKKLEYDAKNPTGDPANTIENVKPEDAINGAEKGLAVIRKETAEKAQETTKEKAAEKKGIDIEALKQDIATAKENLARNYPEPYRKMAEDQVKFLENILAQEEAKIKLSPEAQKIQDEIKRIDGMLERDDRETEENKYRPEERKILLDARAEKLAKLQAARELDKGEISPETIRNDKIIKEVAIRAVNPQNNQNRLENDKRVSFTENEIKNILDNEKDPAKRAEQLKIYLIGALDNTIKVRNEAKYGKSWLAGFKQKMNEGWWGAVGKTAAGAGLISAGLANPMLGVLNPVIYGMGIRMLAEGATQLGQEVYDIFNKNSRKKLLENGRVGLEQSINAKIAELAKNPEMADDEKYTQAMMEFINSVYAQEVTNLVDNDTESLRKAENLRRHAGWAGAAGGILALIDCS
ncbi:MAG: hypothetical protein M1338_00385, partial [Patescibacteria group bacterium]|nr:hypothetical protein [Patescibacteria group bacterium]